MNSIITNPATKQVAQPDNFEKGLQFEEYIKNLFNQKKFKVIIWRKSRKIPDGTFYLDYGCPDLELFFMGYRKHRFAVECKWKKTWEGKLKWAESSQIEKYKNFQNQKGFPVFIAIGIGGEPSNPEKLFVTPLNNICETMYISQSDLLLYNRKPTRRFFYDTCQLKLF